MCNFYRGSQISFACRQKSIRVHSARRDGNVKMLLFIRECYTVILMKSPISIISSMYFPLYHVENGKFTSSSENHLRIQKPVEVPIQTKTIHLCQNILILSRDPVSLKLEANAYDFLGRIMVRPQERKGVPICKKELCILG